MSNMHGLNDASRYPYTFITNYSQIYNDLHMFFSIAFLFEHGKKKGGASKNAASNVWTLDSQMDLREWADSDVLMMLFLGGVGGDFEYWVVLQIISWRIFMIFPDPPKSLEISTAHLQTYQSVSIKKSIVIFCFAKDWLPTFESSKHFEGARIPWWMAQALMILRVDRENHTPVGML